MTSFWTLLPCLCGLACFSGCATPRPALKTVARVDLPRFMGAWYVNAAIPTFIETEAHNGIETYRLEADGTITVGITHHAQDALGDIVHVELPHSSK